MVGAEVVGVGVVFVIEVIEPGATARVVIGERGRRGSRAHWPITGPSMSMVGVHRPNGNDGRSRVRG